MPGKTPQSNGNEPVENGVRNTDVEMKDAKNKGKKGAKDADDEMTVVVPPSKASKQPHKSQDGDGDVSMTEGDAADGGEVKVDPVVQTVTGKRRRPRHPPLSHGCAAGRASRVRMTLTLNSSILQTSRATLPY